MGATFAALSAAACSVPDFQFPDEPLGFAGDGTPIIDHCINGLLDDELGESDFDCGGGCSPCSFGQHCASLADCAEGLCHDGTCIAEGCTNGIKDGAETDADCGGGECKACITGRTCDAAQDCESGVCGEGQCQAPSCDDQVKNGKETGQDCGADCPGCPVDEPCGSASDCISMDCSGGVCGPECGDGLANCNHDSADGCEISTRTDVEHCGACGNACDLPHAVAECSAGECRIAADGCEPGYADCNGEPEDGCEVNLAQDKDNCGACNKVCPAINGAPFCDAAQCQITCDQGYDDCDDKRENGCEKDVSKDVNNCGECSEVCPSTGGTPYCKGGVCGETTCADGFGDCNGDPDDGCEVDLRTDALNCNTCGNLCIVANGTASCNNRVCQIKSCDTDFANCGGGYADGCETNTKTSTSHCGGCGKACTIAGGTPKCDDGACAINSCNGTFRDCNSDPSDGCEINIANNTKNCGGCGAMGSDCSSKYAHASSTCSMSACTAPTCNLGYGDCSGGIADGCETDTTSNGTHCGGCNQSCQTGASAHVMTNACVSSQCDPQCSGSYLTCDNDKFNGCEANGSNDEANCGGCGTLCESGSSAHVTSNDCVGGTCDPQCTGSYKDCDTSRTNGCETNTASSNNNCGGCGMICQTGASAHVSSNTCSGGACSPVCSGLWDDCDSSRLNGCEKDVSSDTANCGACNKACGTSNTTATKCSSGACDPSCSPGWGKCTNPDQGCTTPLGTTANCAACGDSCTAAKPFCDPGGCVAFRDIVVAGSGVHAIGGWDGNNGNAEITLNHKISYAKGNNRMVLVGVAASDPYLEPESVTYDQKPMTLAAFSLEGTSQSWAGVYYLLDANLPDAANTTSPVSVKFWNGAQWGHGGFDVLELKNAQQAAPFASGNASGGNCGGTSTRSATVTYTTSGGSANPTKYANSLVYGLLSGRGATGATLSAAQGLTESWNQQQPTPNNQVGAAAWVIDSDSRTISWSVAQCYNSAQLLVAVQRLTAP